MTLRKLSLLRVLGACMVVVLMSTAAFAQEQTGTVEGHILDSSGVAIPMATITATSAAVQGGSKSVQSDAEGYYRLAQLPVGSYDLSVASSGFATES